MVVAARLNSGSTAGESQGARQEFPMVEREGGGAETAREIWYKFGSGEGGRSLGRSEDISVGLPLRVSEERLTSDLLIPWFYTISMIAVAAATFPVFSDPHFALC